MTAKERVGKVKEFFKTIPGMITGSAAAIGVIVAAVNLIVAASPLTGRVDALEDRQELNIQHIADNTETINKLSKLLADVNMNLSANDYRIMIQFLTQIDAGVGKQKDNILFIYSELLKICENCPSSKILVEDYLRSLK